MAWAGTTTVFGAGPLGPSDRPEAYFNGSSYIRLSRPISLKQLVGLEFRTCVGKLSVWFSSFWCIVHYAHWYITRKGQRYYENSKSTFHHWDLFQLMSCFIYSYNYLIYIYLQLTSDDFEWLIKIFRGISSKPCLPFEKTLVRPSSKTKSFFFI